MTCQPVRSGQWFSCNNTTTDLNIDNPPTSNQCNVLPSNNHVCQFRHQLYVRQQQQPMTTPTPFILRAEQLHGAH